MAHPEGGSQVENVLEKQNDVLIALLARSTLTVRGIYDVVTKGKRNPGGYIKMYNALRGTIGVTEAGKLAGVSAATASVILRNWETQGIIYDAGEANRPLYKRLLPLPEKLEASD
jgi:hypothetical protein